MCVVSNVGDYWQRRLPERYPWVQQPQQLGLAGVSQEDFDKLRTDVEEIKRQLSEARKIDAAEGNADCGTEEKLALIREVARLIGVDLDA